MKKYIVSFILMLVLLCFYKAVDASLFSFVQMYAPYFDNIFKAITNMSSFLILILICFLSFLYNKNISFWMVFNLLNTVILNYLLKITFTRDRPLFSLIEESGYSFPSGHSMVSLTFYGFIIYLIWKLGKDKKKKIILTSFLGLLILLVGMSRIYLGVHYASDVLAGYIISFVYLSIFIYFVNPKLERNKIMVKKKSIFKSFHYALEGLKSSLLNERNMQIHFSFMVLVILLGLYLKISYIEWLVCLILFGLVISLELINTAIENTVDICMPDINPKAKLAKDVAAGSVFIGAITAFFAGLIIFLPKIINLIASWF